MNKSRMKKADEIRKMIGLLVVPVACSAVICGCGNKVDGYFDGMEWGISPEDAKQILTEKENAEPVENEDASQVTAEVENYRGVDGVTADIECSFEDQKLDEVFVFLTFDENTYTNEDIMDRYADLFTEDYGKCSDDSDAGKTWKLGKSEVQLADYSYGALVIDYMQKS